MFNHTDSLQTSSWHAHVQGKKWWYVCGPNEGPGPRQNERECMEAVLYPGESLYYPRHWHHHTQNLETPTMTVTGTVVHADVFDSVARQLHGECTGRASDFMFSAALCDALQSCYPLWYKRWRPRHATGREHGAAVPAVAQRRTNGPREGEGGAPARGEQLRRAQLHLRLRAGFRAGLSGMSSWE